MRTARPDRPPHVPFDTVAGVARAGAVNVVYQSATANGPSSARNQLWPQVLQTTEGRIIGSPTSDGQFGGSLAAGDFNGDGCSDVAIGAPGEEVFVRAGGFPSVGSARFDNAGAVHILYGKPIVRLSAALSAHLHARARAVRSLPARQHGGTSP